MVVDRRYSRSEENPDQFPSGTSSLGEESAPLLGAQPCSRASPALSRFLPAKKDNLGREGSTGSEEAGPSTRQEAWFCYRGSRVKAKHTGSHVSWKPQGPDAAVSCCRLTSQKLPYDEILSAWLMPQPHLFFLPKDFSLVIYSLARPRSDPSNWRVQQHVLSAATLEQAKEWVGMVNGAVAARDCRPRNLLVFINPFSGSGRSRHVWDSTVMPVFLKARIKFTVIETLYQGHATEALRTLKGDELAKYHGLVAIGGDGLFQEVLMGLLQHRSQNPESAEATARLRVGHVPGGSTDAVACSLYNTRSAEAAALHIALGDRHPLDVARVDAQDGTHKYFVCQAAYGFLGDVMKFSEGMRALGPSRYEVAGAVKYLQLRSYRVQVSYQAAPDAPVDQVCLTNCQVCRAAAEGLGVRSPGQQGSGAGVLGPGSWQGSGAQQTDGASTGQAEAKGVLFPGLGLEGSRATLPFQLAVAPGSRVAGPAAVATAAGQALDATALSQRQEDLGRPGWSTQGNGSGSLQQQQQQQPVFAPDWVHLEDDFISVQSVVLPCRSEKSKNGIIPHGHLADGRMYLVLVYRCNHAQYLRFLLQLSHRGLHDVCLPFVRVIPVTTVTVKPVGVESSWNVDGELLSNNCVGIQVQRGLAEVFARGVES